MNDNLQDILHRLTPQQRQELLQRLEKRTMPQGPQFPPAQPLPAGQPALLSFSQQRMWFLDQIEPDGTGRNIPFAVRISGAVDPQALIMGVTGVVARHEVLRTVFVNTEEGPRQVVVPALAIEVPVTRLDSAANMAVYLDAFARRSFSLTEGPLLRAELVLAGSDQVLIVVAHHIVFDGWSIDVFLRELEELYHAARDGSAPSLTPLSAQYADWAAYQREKLNDAAMEDLLRYWKRKLDGVPAVTSVPSDKPRSEAEGRQAGQCTYELPAGLVLRLEEFVRREQTTVNVAMLVAFALTLHAETGAEDLVLGMPVAGRRHPAAAGLIGAFANTVALRIDMSGNPTLQDLVRQAHRTFVEAYEHQDAPYVQVVEAVSPPRAPHRNPLFQILFSVASEDPSDPREQFFTPLPTTAGASDFDMLVSLTHRPGSLSGTIGFNAAVYFPDTVHGLLARMTRILGELIERSEQHVGSVALLQRRHLGLWASFPVDGIMDTARMWLRMLHARTELSIASSPQTADICLVREADYASAGDMSHALVVGVCPSPSTGKTGVSPQRNVIGVEEWGERYRVSRVQHPSDPGRYSVEFNSAAATEIIRRLVATSRSTPATVLVVVDERMPQSLWHEPLSALSAKQLAAGREVVLLAQSDYNVALPGVRMISAEPDLVAQIEHLIAEPERCLALVFRSELANVMRERVPLLAVVLAPDHADELAPFAQHLWALDVPSDPLPVLDVQMDGLRLEHIATELSSASAIAMQVMSFGDDGGSDAANGSSGPPRNRAEQAVADIWLRLLPQATGMVREDFFTAGGHSMLALELISAIRDELQVVIPLPAFFSEPTIESLARAIGDGAGRAQEPIARVQRGGALELSASQLRYWTATQLGDDPSRFNTTYAARLRGTLDEQALRAAVAAVVNRHEVLRSTFPDTDGHPVVVFDPSSDPWLATVDLSDTTEDERDTLVASYVDQHALTPYDLAAGPPFRVRLLVEGPEQHVLVLGMHHIVSDNSSWGILLRELGMFYEAEIAGTAQPNPLPVQFADYAAWHRTWLAGPEGQDRLETWASLLSDVPETSGTATDHPREPVFSTRAGRVDRLFAAELGPRLQSVGRKAGTTLFTVLLAGYGLALRRFGCTPDMVVGTPVAGRFRSEAEGLIGSMADLLPLRLEIPDGDTFRDLVSRVRQAVTHAQGLQETPFGAILERLRPARNSAYHPVFQNVFAFLEGTVTTIGGLPLESLPVAGKGTDFDLFLTMSWSGDRLEASLRYAADLYSADTASLLLETLEALLVEAARAEDQPSSQLAVPAGFRMPQFAPGTVREATPIGRLNVAASFTAEPIADAAEHWLRLSGTPREVHFAPFSQLIQPLLDPEGPLHGGPEQVNALLIRWQDLASDAQDPRRALVALENAAHELLAAVRHYRQWSAAPLLIGICPPSAAWRQPGWREMHDINSSRFCDAAGRVDGVTCHELGEPVNGFGIADPDDHVGDELARMPYTAEAYAVIGTALAMAVLGLEAQAIDTVIVDPDLFSGSATAVIRHLRTQVRSGRRLISGPVIPDSLAHPRNLVLSGDLLSWCGEATNLDATVALVSSAATAKSVASTTPGLTVFVAPAESDNHPMWMANGPMARRLPTPVALALRDTSDAAAVISAIGARGRTADETAYVSPESLAEQGLAEIVGELLHLERVSVVSDFFTIGGDSLLAIQLVSRAARVGIRLTPREVLRYRTIQALAAAAQEVPVGEAADEPFDGPIPMLPTQRWFLQEIAPTLANPSHFNHPYYLVLRDRIPVKWAAQAAEVLLRRHAALRLRFTRHGQGWRAAVATGSEPAVFTSHDLSHLDPDERHARLQELLTAEQEGLNLEHGPVSRLAHFDLGPDEPQRLLMVNHHLVVDGVSRGVLLSDLELLLDQLDAGQQPVLAPIGTSLATWARDFDGYAQSAELRAEAGFWLSQSRPRESQLVPDADGGPVTISSLRIVRRTIEPAAAGRLREAARQAQLRFADVLAAEVARVIAQWSGGDEGALYLVNLGRPELLDGTDLSSTVGWFQTRYPARFRGDRNGSPWQWTRKVIPQLTAASNGGIGYLTLLYQSPWEDLRAQLAAMAKPEVSFNYLGDVSAAINATWLRPATDFHGHAMDESGLWPHRLDFVISSHAGGLRVELTYSRNVFLEETAGRIVDDLVAGLARLEEQENR